MTQAQDIIKGALLNIGAYQSGDALASADSSDSLAVFNDLRASLSTDKDSVFGVNENILNWTAGQRQYKVGNPLCTDIGEPPFTGTVTGGSPTITSVTAIPADLKVGATLTDLGNVFPAGTTVTGFNAIAQTVTMSANASATPSVNPDSITYSIPGDFAIARPLYITSGYTRINALDFTLDVYESEQRYNEILYKAQPGPWPTVGWYNMLYPYGILNVYQQPSASVEFHLFTKTILAPLTLTQTLIEPQGYARAWKWILARELWPQYWSPKPWPSHLDKLLKESLGFVQSLNAKPAVVSRYEPVIVRGNRPDGGYILHGGYR